MLQPICDSNASDALRLLQEGFADRKPCYWETVFHRLNTLAGREKTGVPIGFLMRANAKSVGVILTPARRWTAPTGCAGCIVNLSSWYIEPEFRWRAPLMMRALLRIEGAAFTDLTPTPAVQEMLQAFDFKPINDGVSLNLLTVSRHWGSRAARVAEIDSVPSAAIGVGIRQALEGHREFGCMIGVLQDDEGWHPLAFKSTKIRGLPAAMLVYAENNEAVYRNLGAIARYLTGNGKMILQLDVPPHRSVPGFKRRKRSKKFGRGLSNNNRTDYLGSELALFDW